MRGIAIIEPIFDLLDKSTFGNGESQEVFRALLILSPIKPLLTPHLVCVFMLGTRTSGIGPWGIRAPTRPAGD